MIGKFNRLINLRYLNIIIYFVVNIFIMLFKHQYLINVGFGVCRIVVITKIGNNGSGWPVKSLTENEYEEAKKYVFDINSILKDGSAKLDIQYQVVKNIMYSCCTNRNNKSYFGTVHYFSHHLMRFLSAVFCLTELSTLLQDYTSS